VVPDPPSFALHASVETAAVEDSRYVREVVAGRLRAAADQDAGPATWAQGLIGWGLTGRDGDAGRLDRFTSGAFGGFDVTLPGDWRAGVLAGHESTGLWPRRDHGSGSVDSDQLGLYAGGSLGRLSVELGGAYGWRRLDLARRPTVPGAPHRMTSNSEAQLFQSFGEFGFRFGMGPATVEPFLGATYLAQSSDPFLETGEGASIAGSGEHRKLGMLTVGVRETATFDIAGVAAQLTGAFGWRRAFGELTPQQQAVTSDGQVFDAPGNAVARNGATLEGGVQFPLRRRLVVGLTYNGQIGANLDAVAVRAGLHWRF
jgi:fibronectin-binding autotransporter adhesin